MIRNKCPLNDRHVYPSMAHIECFTCRLSREYREMLCFLLFDKRYIAVIHKLSIKLASYRLDRKINVNTQCRCDSMLKKSIVIILIIIRSEEHTSELQSRFDLVCRLLLEKKKNTIINTVNIT